jgi:hypothetical protein
MIRSRCARYVGFLLRAWARNLQFVDGLIDTVEMKMGTAHKQMPERQHRIAGAQPHGLSDVRLRVLGVPEKHLVDTRVGMGIGVVAIELKGDLELPERLLGRAARGPDLGAAEMRARVARRELE